MATPQDLALARRLLAEGVLGEDALKRALSTQGDLLRQGRIATLERVLYAMHLLPPESLAVLDAPPLLQTQPFADYRLDTILGEGGGSTVYGAVYLPNGTPVAMKVLDPLQALRPAFLARFREEARLHIQLDHENVVAGYETGVQGGYHFYSMDLVDGLTVLEVIDHRGRLESAEALSISLQIARALGYLHGQGLLHRDIKPGNVMVEASGDVRLIDLGLVGRLGAASAGEADPGTTVGTVEYLSPEQARGRTDLDARADLYSLGMTLYHMVVGEVAFHGETSYEVMAKQILSTMDAQKIKTRSIPPEVYFLIAKLTAKEREERMANADEVVRLIESYLPGGIVPVDLGTPPVVEPVAPPAPPTSPRAPARGADAPRRPVRGDDAPRRPRGAGGSDRRRPRRRRGR